MYMAPPFDVSRILQFEKTESIICTLEEFDIDFSICIAPPPKSEREVILVKLQLVI